MKDQTQSTKWRDESYNVWLVAVLMIIINGVATAPLLAQNPLYTQTQPADAIRASRARLNGMVLPGSNPATTWFEWGTNLSYGTSAGLTNLPVSDGVIAIRFALESLTQGPLYHYRLVASNLLGAVYGVDQQFTLGANVTVWGNPAFGHTIVPDDLTNAVAIGGGGDHCLALRNDGTVTAWGGDAYGQRDVPALSDVVAVAAGQFHNLALLSDGTVTAWGAGTTLGTDFPEGGQSIVPAGLTDVVQIAAGTTHSLALKADGTVVAWGSARINCCFWTDMGQAVVPAGLSNVVAISGGDFHSMALKADGTVVVWGDDTYGQADIPPGLNGVVAMKAGWYHNLALKADRTLAAWGYDAFGEVSGVPQGQNNVAGMAGGGFQSLALQTNGTALGWGDNSAGQRSIPINLQNAIVGLAAGYDFSLALHRPVASFATLPGPRYVDANSANPTPPYTNWTTAASTIQDAVDAALAGDPILVTNGVYQAGGKAVAAAGATTSNRVAVDKAVSVQSVNGPQFTVIQGYQVPGTTNGTGAVRCVYLTNGASISGFTLTNGGTVFGQRGGGVCCQLTNSVVTNNPVVTNCILVGNSASVAGGGAFRGILINCTLAGNSTGNNGYGGGGAASCTLRNCILTGNSSDYGGGAADSMLYNCVLSGNSAVNDGGGEITSTLNNCTVTGNSAGHSGGGTVFDPVRNSIVYNNTAPDGANYLGGSFNHCCTTPLPSGPLNISSDPQLASASHLSAGSPCREAGTAFYATGTDIDGEAWASPPSIGCDEYHAGAVSGPLTVGIGANFTSVMTNFPVALTALIEGRTTASSWDFGDGVVSSNQPFSFHVWQTPGNYAVVLRAYNESLLAGISATVMVHVVAAQPIHYVAPAGVNPAPPYNSWATAATNIQDAVDAATVPGALVLVTNGTYAAGGRLVVGTMTNRVAVNKLLELRSVNGPQFTRIEGHQALGATNADGAVRCVYLATGARLSGFTLTNGATMNQGGGGVWCQSTNSIVSNCVMVRNSASSGGGAIGGILNNCTLIANSASQGGGAFGCTLNNCMLSGNFATNYGGGVQSATLNNCTLTSNSAGDDAGGAYSANLNNCIIYFNAAPDDANYSGSTLNFCCTTPPPASGMGNIIAEPQLADSFHLAVSSPCRGAGNAAYLTGVDIDGETWANLPSIGCDEFHAEAITGPLNIAIQSVQTNVATGFRASFTATIVGHASANLWDFGDGTFMTNRLSASHAWQTPGLFSVVLRVYNESSPSGVSTAVPVHVVTPPVHYVAANSSNPAPPYVTWATAATQIQDAVDATSVPGALVMVTNGIYQIGGRVVYGALTNRVAVSKPVTVQSVNGAAVTIIQGYQEASGINSDRAVRCVYLTNGATLVGFTLTNGATRGGGNPFRELAGGGVLCESPDTIVSNCVLIGNSALNGGGVASGGTLYNCLLISNSASYGGAAYGAALDSCTLSGNSAGNDGGAAYKAKLGNCLLANNSASDGGGASFCSLNNCTLAGNSAGYGGGVVGGTLNNCILYFNSASQGANYLEDTVPPAVFHYCCTTPLPTNGVENIASDPLFVDQAGGNLRLQSTSPCINSGLNVSAPASSDLDGNPRIAGGTVDIGAYEFQAPASVISYAWLQQYGLVPDVLVDSADPDGDGMSNWEEWIAGTIPTNGLSALQLLKPSHSTSSVVVTWQSVSDRTYFLERSINLGANPAFLTLATNLAGQAGTTTYTDTYANGSGPYFYRVGIQTASNQFHFATSLIPFPWLEQFGQATDGSADYTDPDGDGMNNWEEWVAGTVPTDQSSALRLLKPSRNPAGLAVSWQSVSNRTYFLERATNLVAALPFTLLTSNIVGQFGTTSYSDTNATGRGPYLYRVGVQQ